MDETIDVVFGDSVSYPLSAFDMDIFEVEISDQVSMVGSLACVGTVLRRVVPAD